MLMEPDAMNKSVPVSVRLPPELNDDVTAIAAALDRSKSWVIEQAVKDYVALQAWQLAEIDEGIRDADAGRVVPHEKVVAWIKSWDGPEELPMPECG
jgi:predicted transcriptional regulator